MKKRLFAILTAVIALTMVFALTACGPTVTVTISQDTAEVTVGKTVTLTATASDDSEITWTTSDKAIATVSSKGVVAGVGAGTVTITAASGEAKATCTVTVKAAAPAPTVAISETTATVDRGKTITLTATASDGSEITWTTSAPSIATVENGVVTGVSQGSAVITASSGTARATCTVTVTDTEAPEDYYKIEFGEEGATPEKTWVYWNNQGWVDGGSVTVAMAEHRNATATISFSGNDLVSVWYGMQLFYKDSTLTADENYKLSCKINTTAAGDITLNGNAVSLTKGENNVTVYFKNVSDMSAVDIQMGVSGKSTLPAATVSISELAWEVYTPQDLAAPSLTLSGKTVTIADTNTAGVSSYQLGFFAENSDSPKYTAAITNGGTFDDSLFDNGVYTVKIRALAAGGYNNSAWSADGVSHTVSNSGISYDIEFKDETAAANNAGRWYYWKEWTEVTTSTYADGVITFAFTNNAGNWYNTQLFFKDSSLTVGNSYTLTMKINSTSAGKITVNGSVVTLVAGDNNVSVTYTEGADGRKVSVSMQLGVNEVGIDIAAGTLTISDIAFAAAT